MRIWVDCTAAAHPLVLRPMIERLRGRGHEVEITAREYGQTVGILERLGLEHEVVGSHGGGATAGKGAGARPPQRARSPAGRAPRRFDLAIAHGSVDLAVVSHAAADPARRRCRTTSTPASSASSPSAPPAGCWSPTRSRSRPCAAPAPPSASSSATPGLKEDYYLADFTPDPAVLDELGIDRDRVLAVVRPPPETSAYHAAQPALRRGASTGWPPTSGAVAVVIPRTEGQQAAAVASAPEPVADRPRAGDRRPEPDRLRRPRRQRRRDDEPRGGRARHARLHDLQRPDGRGRRGA